jgi:hypothetical protein
MVNSHSIKAIVRSLARACRGGQRERARSPKEHAVGKKNRSGNREPRKPKQPKTVHQQATSLGDLMKPRASTSSGAK